MQHLLGKSHIVFYVSTPASQAPEERLRARLRDLIDEALSHQHLVLERDFWMRNRENDAALLRGIGTEVKTDHATLELLRVVRMINRQVHDGVGTRGAAKYRHLVAQLQGGEYCCLCGSHDALHVDHRVPTALAGDPTDLNNLQLLCEPCNTGKGATLSGRIAGAFVLAGTQQISTSTRYLRLYLGSTMIRGRLAGMCDLGHQASLRNVIRAAPTYNRAANVLSLSLTCTEGCSNVR